MDYVKNQKEAIAIVKQMVADGHVAQDIAEKYFPELKESEDERIRKIIKASLQSYFDGKLSEGTNDVDYAICLAWLEKQGEQSNWKPSKDEMDALYGLAYITNKMDDKKDEAVTKLYQDLKREFFSGVSYENMFPSSPVDALIKLEKQGEQKPADKIEPKFKIGDWAVSDLDKMTRYISEVHNDKYNNYYVIKGDVETECNIDEYDRLHHLWTIQDAKDGDVLATPNYILIYEKALPEDGGVSYCHYDFDSSTPQFDFNKDDNWYFGKEAKVHPATKEQRDILFQKMKEAGYEWDAEKKELKKIEQKPATMSLDEAIEHCKEKSCGNNACALEHKQLAQWLKELKGYKEQKPWSEEDDDNLSWLVEMLLGFDGNDIECYKDKKFIDKCKEVCKWLKAIKDRTFPQPKQEWSEEDEEALEVAIIALEDMYSEDSPLDCYAGHHIPFDKAANQLKSLKERYTWKPSDEQINALSITVKHGCTDDKEALGELLEQLKAL